jgi:L-rhamnose mutarotase
MIRKTFIMFVDPKAHAEYERRHREIWPEVLTMLKEHGVHNYSISLDAETSILFGYAEIESEARWEAIGETEICRKWWNHMKDLMPSEPSGKRLSRDLHEVFYLQ